MEIKIKNLHKFVVNHKIPNNMKKVYLLITILIQASVVFSQHFIKGYTGNGTNQMNLIVNNAKINGVQLVTGDEIAVFDGNLCVGMVVLAADLDPLQSTTYPLLVASADDGNANGFKPGNKMYFRFWDSSAGIEYHNVIPVVTDNQGTEIANAFDLNGTAYINASTANTTVTWVGGNNAGGPQNWGNINNWNPKVIPEPFHSVVIPTVSATRHPSIYAGTNAFAGSISIANNITLTIWSDDTGDGSFIVSNGITGNGVAVGMRQMTPDAWHLFSSFAAGLSISDFLTSNVAIPTKGVDTRGLITYNESIDNWNDLMTNSSGGNIEPGQGYCVRIEDQGDPALNSVAFNGTFVNGNVQVSLSRSNNGWNLIGNPLTSAMYVRQEVNGFLTVNKDKLDASYIALYLWDPAANDYKIVNNNEGQSNLALSQGFFVKAAAAGNVTFTQQMQIHQTDAPFKSGVIQWPSVVLSAKAGDVSSSTKINFNEEMTLGLDPGYDAGILRSGKGFDIYSKLVNDNGVDFAIQALSGKTTDSYVIPIGIDAVKGGEVVFSANAFNLPAGYDLMLEDKLTNSIANLKNGEMYVANIASDTKGTGRFYLHVGSSVQTAVQEFQQNELSVYTIDKTLYIKGNVGKNAQFNVYSIDGRLINRFGATSQNLNQMSTAGFTPGIYFVKVMDKTKYKPVKFIVEN
jgi:hypothetical protein